MCRQKNEVSITHKQRELDELQLLLFEILIYFKIMNFKEIISFNNRKE